MVAVDPPHLAPLLSVRSCLHRRPSEVQVAGVEREETQQQLAVLYLESTTSKQAYAARFDTFSSVLCPLDQAIFSRNSNKTMRTNDGGL